MNDDIAMKLGAGKKKVVHQKLFFLQLICRENYKYEVTPNNGERNGDSHEQLQLEVTHRLLPLNPVQEPKKPRCGENYVKADRWDQNLKKSNNDKYF